MRAHARSGAEQRVAHVIAIAHISELKAAQIAKTFFEREEIRKRLARDDIDRKVR